MSRTDKKSSKHISVKYKYKNMTKMSTIFNLNSCSLIINLKIVIFTKDINNMLHYNSNMCPFLQSP